MSWELDDPMMDPGALRAANYAHDLALDRLHIDPHCHVRTGWSRAIGFSNGPLTDRKIEKYRTQGYYSQEFKEARKKLQAMRRGKREGNFTRTVERLIYSPL